jgi:hypothetical protein
MFTNLDGSVTPPKVTEFYEPFHGHDAEDLALALAALRRQGRALSSTPRSFCSRPNTFQLM